MILIVGGNGTLGRCIVPRLLDAGVPVRIMTRTPEKAIDLAIKGADVVPGDLRDRSSLARACENATAVVAAAHSMLGSRTNASVHVDRDGHLALIDAASEHGVRHFVYTSTYDGGPPFRDIPFFRIKLEVENYLKRSGLPYTILRPTAFIETHAHMLIGRAILEDRRVLLFGAGNRRRNFVAADDVARVAVESMRDRRLLGETVDVAGPENHTSMDVVRLYESISGRRARVTHVPLALLRRVSKVAAPLHPGIAQILQSGILTETLGQEVHLPDFDARFGFKPTRLEDWIRARAPEATGVGV